MTREELKNRLHEETACVRVSPELEKRALLAAQGKDRTYMKRKISAALAFALLAVTLCAAALAAAGRWGMLDFADQYATKHYIPEDAQTYVETDLAVMENEWATVAIRELYYDGRTSRVTVDVTPKEENTLIVSEDTFMEDPFVNLTNNYVQDGKNDMRPVYQVIQDEGYERVYSASVFMNGAIEDMGMGAGDHMLDEDGTLTLYSQEEYLTDMPEREVTIRVILMPFEEPLTMEGRMDYDRAAVLDFPYTLVASVNPTVEPVAEGELANVCVSETDAEYPSVGVRVDRVLIEVKPQEIYATIDYTVTDEAAYAKTDGGLWFEFIDPAKKGEPWEQQLAAGLSGGGTSGPIDREEENPTRFRQTETLGKNELHDVYTLRAFECWEKERFETREIFMRPATAEDMKN